MLSISVVLCWYLDRRSEIDHLSLFQCVGDTLIDDIQKKMTVSVWEVEAQLSPADLKIHILLNAHSRARFLFSPCFLHMYTCHLLSADIFWCISFDTIACHHYLYWISLWSFCLIALSVCVCVYSSQRQWPYFFFTFVLFCSFSISFTSTISPCWFFLLFAWPSVCVWEKQRSRKSVLLSVSQWRQRVQTIARCQQHLWENFTIILGCEHRWNRCAVMCHRYLLDQNHTKCKLRRY